MELKVKCECLEESPRAKQIRETNERVHLENSKMVWKSRHEGTNRTTLSQRSEFIKECSNDNG